MSFSSWCMHIFLGTGTFFVLVQQDQAGVQAVNPSDSHFMFPPNEQIQNLTCPTVACPTCTSPTCIPTLVASQGSMIVSAQTLIATGGVHVQGNITQGGAVWNLTDINAKNQELHARLGTLETQLNSSMTLSEQLQTQLNYTMVQSELLERRFNESLAQSQQLQRQLNDSLANAEHLQGQLSGLLPQLLNSAGRMNSLNATISQVETDFENFVADPSVSRIRVGNQILNLLSISLPYQQIHSTADSRCARNTSNPMFPYGSMVSSNGCGYSSDQYLHLKTNYVCGAPTVHVMYHFNFRGYLFRNAESFNCRCFGYLYGTRGLTFNTTNCDDTYPSRTGTNINMTTYCSPDGNYLVSGFFCVGDGVGKA